MLFCNLKIMEKTHILAGIALVGSVLGEPVKAQEGTDNAASRTNKALVELLSELPAGFDKAWGVIQWDVTLTEDGDLSDSDKAAIENHMWKLATTVVAEKAKKVMEAMNGVETVVAANEEGDKLAPLNESSGARREREEREKILEKVNKRLMMKDSWLIDKEKGWDARISSKDNTLIFEFKNRNTDTLSPEGTINCFVQLPPGGYEIELDNIGATPLIYLYDSSEWRIDQSWRTTKDRINLSKWINKLFIPSNCAKLLISISVNNNNSAAEIKSMIIKANWDILKPIIVAWE